ncbi:MAG: class I SAM-dependent methyltransferase [Candidatus Nealsonbacteria bacterium]|nr:class I SAM-dependent methyltransferase [Candidatus Nealsonbacteria bacterium]
MNGFLNPAEVLKQLKLKKTMTAADFGCGAGGWVLPLARILEEGRVYGIDILEEPLSALRSKAKTDKLYNVVSLRADIEKGTTLLNGSCDVVLMTNLLFQASNKKGILAEGKRVLKSNGKILVVDWKKEAPFGPEQGRITAEDAKELAKETGLETEKEFEASSSHWALILSPVEN